MNTVIIQKWGNSQGIRIPKHVLENFNIGVGESLEYEVIDNSIVLKVAKKRKRKGKYKLKDLLEQIDDNFKNEEYDWGQPSEQESL